MENEPEVIRQNMQDQRTALTEKLEALEEKVMGVATSVTDSVESVKEGVTDTVEAVKETVENTVEAARDLFNLSEHVRRHPWVVLGGAVGVGFLVGALLRRRGREPVARRSRRDAPPAADHQGNGARKEAEPGPADSLFSSVTAGLNRIKDAAFGALFGTVERVLAQELPQAVESHIKTFVDDSVTKLHNALTEKPAESSVSEPPRQQRERQEAGFDTVTGRPFPPGSW